MLLSSIKYKTKKRFKKTNRVYGKQISVDLDALTKLLQQSILPYANKNEEIHQHAQELAYETIPEMFIPVNMILVDGKINNIPVKILFDTGANVSVIFKKTVDKLNMTDMIDPKGSDICRGIGTELSLGKLWLVELEINDNIFPIMLTVTQTNLNNFDLIIGLDFMRSYKAHIDLTSNTITLNDKYYISF